MSGANNLTRPEHKMIIRLFLASLLSRLHLPRLAEWARTDRNGVVWYAAPDAQKEEEEAAG